MLVLPLPGTSPDGLIRAVYAENSLKLSEQAIQTIAPNALVIIGSARPFLKEWAKTYDFNLIEIIDMDENSYT